MYIYIYISFVIYAFINLFMYAYAHIYSSKLMYRYHCMLIWAYDNGAIIKCMFSVADRVFIKYVVALEDNRHRTTPMCSTCRYKALRSLISFARCSPHKLISAANSYVVKL